MQLPRCAGLDCRRITGWLKTSCARSQAAVRMEDFYDEAELCDYELKRLENIRKNQDILRSLGQ